MREVARHLGLSVTTVSFVLNGRPGIAQKTRERVMKAVEELGYTPSLVGKAINRKRSGVIGVVVPVSAGAIFPGILEGVNRAAEKKGQPIFVSYSQDRSNIEAKTLRLYSQLSMDGLIIATAPNDENDLLLHQLNDSGTAIVQVERYRDGVPGPFVGSDNRTAAFDATNRLLRMGHRKIGCIFPAVLHSVNDERQLGYTAAMRAAGIDPDPRWTRYLLPRRADYQLRIEEFQREIAAYLTDPDAPKAILWCMTGVEWLARVMEELKLVNGRDVEIVLFDIDASIDLRGQRFINVLQDGPKIGVAAFDLLLQQLDSSDTSDSGNGEAQTANRIELRIGCQQMELYGLKMLDSQGDRD